jgi:hypothetical protein
MKILVIFDGSDDGFAGLQAFAKLLGSLGWTKDFTLAIVGWPPRLSPIWDRAFERQGIVDDLHRAMAEVAAKEFDRLRWLFAPFGSITTEYLEGDPVSEIVALVKRTKPGLIVAGVTRGRRAGGMNENVTAFLQHTESIPTLLAFGTRHENDE